MECRIAYDFFRSPSQETELRAIVEPLRWMLPSWVHNIQFARESALNCDSMMDVTSDGPYHEATINVFDRFYEAPEDEQRNCVIHEFWHLHHASIDRLVEGSMLEYIKAQNEDLAAAWSREYTDRMESFIQNSADLLDRVLPPTEAETDRRIAE